jgi:hypothetical protein
MTFNEAHEEALEKSRNSNLRWYVNWIEDNEFEVSCIPEFNWQDYYYQGDQYWGEDE